MTAAVKAIDAGNTTAQNCAVADLSARLGEPRRRIEGAFVAVGDRLGQCVELLSALSELFEGLPRRLEGAAVTEAEARLRQVAAAAEAMAVRLTAEQEGLKRLMAVVARVERPVGEISSAVRAIGMVALNARVAAASLTGDNADFCVFTADIARLSEHATRTIRAFADVYGELVASLRAADAQSARFDAGRRSDLSQFVVRVNGGLEAVAARRSQAAAASLEVGRLSAQIRDRVGTAVFALQIGDITRQRVEHVEAALDALSAHLAAGDDAAVAGAICRLQAEQLSQAIAAFEGELDQVVRALGSLRGEACEVVRRGQAVFGAERGSFLVELAEELRRTCDLIRSCEAASAELDRAARRVVERVAELAQRIEAVQAIEAEMRLVSLNMALQCSRLGQDGRALKVIAQELGGLVAATVGAAELVVDGLGEAQALAQSLSSVWTDGEASASLEAEAAASVALLEGVDADLADALGVLAGDGDQVARLLAVTARDMRIREDIGQALRGILAELEAAAEGGGPPSAEAVERAREILGARYTMASERALHDRFFDAAPAPTPELEEDLSAVLL